MRNLIFTFLFLISLQLQASAYEPLDLGLNLPKLKVALKTVKLERDRIEILKSIHDHLVKFISNDANKTNRSELYWTAIDNDSIITRMIDLGCQKARKNLAIEIDMNKETQNWNEVKNLETDLNIVSEICR